MRIAEAIAWATAYLNQHQIEDAHLEAEILLCHSLSIKRPQLIAEGQRVIGSRTLEEFQGHIKRRINHEPTAYITGAQPFMSLDFFVDRSVLIPRPETEQLVEIIIESIHHLSFVIGHLTLVDVGTGCGCIAISLAKYLPNVKVIGIDSSSDAIRIAQKNAEYHKVNDRCQFIVGNMFEPFLTTKTQRHEETQRFDIVVSNPPYIPSSIIDTLPPEVKDWEPRQALDGGEDGLLYIRKIIEKSPRHLKENGFLILEFGINQAEAIKELAKEYFKATKIIRDYSGKERVFSGQL